MTERKLKPKKAEDLRRGDLYLRFLSAYTGDEKPRRVLDISRPRKGNKKMKVVLDTPEELLIHPDLLVIVEEK